MIIKFIQIIVLEMNNHINIEDKSLSKDNSYYKYFIRYNLIFNNIYN